MNDPAHKNQDSGLERFWRELQRRNVVRVGLAYLAFSWLIIQLVGAIGPIIGLPQWVPRLILVLLSLGFGVSLVLAWAYELTSQGFRTTAEVDARPSLRRVSPQMSNFIVIGALTLALGYFIWESRFAGGEARGEPQSIAVLPFRDLSAQGDQQYFADGVAEELINTLSRIEGLKVAGRMSSFALRGSEDEPREVGEKLGVTHLLEGSVRTAGGRLRVSAQLVKAEDGFQVWAHEFEGDLADVFAVQDEISGMVAEGLKLHLQAAPGEALPQVPSTTNLAAYNDYLLGRYHLARRTTDGLRAAQAHLRAATQADPAYAPAWAALAKALAVSPYYLPVESAPLLAESAKTTARKAIALDPENAEAWSALGTVQLIFERDWAGAAESLQRAVEAHPNDVDSNNLYGDYLYTIGDYQAALEYESRAASLEPLSPANQHELAVVYELLGRMDEAIAQERLAIQVGPEFRNAWSTLARYFTQVGRWAEVRELLATHRELLGEHFALWLEVRLALADGDRVQALARAEQLQALVRESNLPLTMVARVYAELGDDAGAAALVREAYAAGDPILVSPLYFFLPEDWPELPLLRAALEQPDLTALYDLRRANIAAGRGRVEVAPVGG